MEKGVDGRTGTENGDYLSECFGLPRRAWDQYSPLTLAYLGDAVYDVLIRTVLVKRANMQTAKLHGKASALVRAGAQAKLVAALQPYLTEEEAGVYRRGRNAQPCHTAKNASRREYLEATGFEALIGYLYLKGDIRRLIDLIRLGLKESGHEL